MRHRQVATPLFLIHRHSTTEPPKGLTKSLIFSPAPLATVDFETLKEFAVRDKRVNHVSRTGHNLKRDQAGDRGGRETTVFCDRFLKNQRKNLRVTRICACKLSGRL